MHEATTLVAKYAIALPVMAVVFEFFRLDKKRRWEFIALLAFGAICTALLVKAATTLHQDPRPFVRDGVHPYFVHATDNGFPSDHTAFSAVIAFVMLRYSRKFGIALLVLSLLIGAARVVAGVHHAQDIIGGFVIAAIGVGLCVLLLNAAKSLRKTS